jgi:opacity protein-like surface antigen
MKFSKILFVALLLSFTGYLNAQFYLGPHVGFKSSGLGGTLKETQNGNVTPLNFADAGNTGFNVGITTGYAIPIHSVYQLDINLDVSYSSFNYLETGINSSLGDGKFSALGMSDGGTTVISFDIMPIHRFSFPGFKLLSPYAGLGMGVNLMMTSDTKRSQNNVSATYTGTSEMKVGILVFYGTLFRITDNIAPYIQFKHFIPFGSETKFTEKVQSAGQASTSEVLSIADVPNYFNIDVGCRFSF